MRTGRLSGDDEPQDGRKGTAWPAAPVTLIWMQIAESWGVSWLVNGGHIMWDLEADWDYIPRTSHWEPVWTIWAPVGLFELFRGNDVVLKQDSRHPIRWFLTRFRCFVQIMYVGYLLDKESMYHQGPVRRSSINLPPQNFVSTPQYPDFTGYHHVPNMDTHAQSAGSWGPSYGAPREDWGAYSLGPPNTIPTPMNNSSPGQVPYCSSEYTHMHPPGSAVLQPPPENVTVAQLSPDRERRNSFQWMSKTAQSSSTGEHLELSDSSPFLATKCCSFSHWILPINVFYSLVISNTITYRIS